MEEPPQDWSENTQRQVSIAEQKWFACVMAVEEICGRVYRDEQMHAMLSIERRPDGDYVRLHGRPAPILRLVVSDGKLIIYKLYAP